jgi:hypothetical protein
MSMLKTLGAEETLEKRLHEEGIVELNNVASYRKNLPITEAVQMPNSLTWNKINENWMQNLKESNPWWLKGHIGNPLEAWEEKKRDHIASILQLRDKLLSFGGEEACMPGIEDDIDKITSRGQFWYGNRIKMMKGQPSQCHRNACDLWDANRDNPKVRVHIATGYALTEDGMWRQHSWLVLIKPRANKIVETTQRRIAYFGFVMTHAEAEVFYGDNLY